MNQSSKLSDVSDYWFNVWKIFISLVKRTFAPNIRSSVSPSGLVEVLQGLDSEFLLDCSVFRTSIAAVAGPIRAQGRHPVVFWIFNIKKKRSKIIHFWFISPPKLSLSPLQSDIWITVLSCAPPPQGVSLVCKNGCDWVICLRVLFVVWKTLELFNTVIK